MPSKFTRRSCSLALALTALGAAACGPGSEYEGASTTVFQGVVYGTDDRFDVYAHPTEALRTLAQQSIAAMIDARAVDVSNPNNVQLAGQTAQAALGLCSDQRFLNDPTPASCSGTLIGPDLLITAGHCIEDAGDCSAYRWVFNFYRDSETTLHTITAADVFSCSEVVLQRNTTINGRRLDFTVLRLDHAATPRFTAVPVRRGSSPLTRGESLTVIGFGSGMPAKVDSGGAVLDPRAAQTDYFTSTIDTFAGNSGSGIFDTETRELVGVLSAGETDYVRRGSCSVVNVCNGSGCSGEIATYAYNAVALLCAAQPTAAPCMGLGTICGNGACDAGEDSATCPSDCVPPPPAAWTCAPGAYATGGTCDCMCGVYDPDCANRRATVMGCATGMACSAEGTCTVRRRSPTTWTCDDARYRDRVACDCNCGAYDPDCRSNLPVNNCAAGETCGADGTCPGGPSTDAGTTSDGGVSGDAAPAGDGGVDPMRAGCTCASAPGAPAHTPLRGLALLGFALGLARVARRRTPGRA